MSIQAAHLMVNVDGNSAGAIRAMDRAEKKAGRFRQIAGAAIKTGALAMGAGAVAAGAGMVKAVGSASVLNEAVNKTQQTFGDAAPVVAEFATQGAESLGMSEAAARQAAGSFGLMLRTTNQSQAATADMSTSLVGLARDMSSIHDIPMEEALTKIQSGLAGESEAVRRMGIDLSAATLKQKALDMGLVDSAKGTLPQSIKMQAAYAAMMEQTSEEQGDFARTSDSVANQQKTMAGMWEDIKSKIGTAALPAVREIMGELTDAAKNVDWTAVGETVADALSAIIDFGGDVVDAIQSLKPTINAVKDWFEGLDIGGTLGPIIDTVSDLFGTLKEIMAPVIDTLQDSFGQMKESMGPALDALRGAWEQLKPALTTVAQILGGVLAVAFGIVVGIVNGVMRALGGLVRMFSGLVEIVAGVFNLIVGLVTGDGDKIKEAVAGIGEGVVNVFGGLWDAIKGFLSGLVDGIVSFFTGLYDTLVGGSIIPDTINDVVDWFAGLPGKVLSWIANLVTGLVVKATKMKDQFTKRVSELVSDAVSWVSGLPGKAVSALAGIGNALTEKGIALVTGLWDGAKALWSDVTSWAGGLGGKIVDAVGDIGRRLYSAGRSIITGLLDGMKAVFEDAKDFVLGIGDWISQHKGPKAYDIKLLRPAGGWIMQGLEEGLRGRFGKIQGVVRDVNRTLASAGDVERANTQGATRPGVAAEGGQTIYSFDGATFQVNVPDGRVSTFERELGAKVRDGQTKARMRAVTR